MNGIINSPLLQVSGNLTSLSGNVVLALRLYIKPSDKLEKAVEKNYDTSDKVGWYVRIRYMR